MFSPLPRAYYRAGKGNWRKATRDVFLGGMPLNVGASCTCDRHPQQIDRAQLLRPVIFIYRAGHSAQGSIDIRVRHLGSALKATSSSDSQIRARTEESIRHKIPKDSDVVLSKTVLTVANRDLVDNLVKNGNRIWADFVDGFETNVFERQLSGYLCASISEYQHRKRHSNQAIFLAQQVDSRWPSGSFEKRGFGTVYVGGQNGTKYLDQLPEVRAVTVSSYQRSSIFRKTVQAVEPYSHHISVRQFFGEGVFKPETKATVAARLGSVFIGSREDLESSLMFSEEYPYLADDSSLRSILHILKYARATFGTKVWHMAVDEMLTLRNHSCDLSVGIELRDWLITQT